MIEIRGENRVLAAIRQQRPFHVTMLPTGLIQRAQSGAKLESFSRRRDRLLRKDADSMTFRTTKLRVAALVMISGLAASICSAATPARTFKHVVIILQENRTPDNVFGSNPNFEPGVDIQGFGFTSTGERVPLTPIPWVMCFDLPHGLLAWRNEWDKGKMDGGDKNTYMAAVRDPTTCAVPPLPEYKYVDNSRGQVQVYFDIAKQYGWANRMFQTNRGPSYAAHQFFLAGTSAPTTFSKLFVSGNPDKEPQDCTSPPDVRVAVVDENGDEDSNPPIYPCFEHPTLPDVLNGVGVSWKYYAESPHGIWTAPNSIDHLCQATERNGVKSCSGPDWLNNVVIGSHRALTDIQDCKLAQVSWITPTEEESDHPVMTDGRGPPWVASLVNALGSHPPCPGSGEVYWEDTLIFITWDDWGGWYDHVPPTRNGQPNGWGKGYTYGFRVPLLVVSAYTPAGFVENEEHDTGSLLKFIETNFSTGRIGPGFYADAYPNDTMQNYFTLQSPRRFVPIHVAFNFKFFLLDHEAQARDVFNEMARCGIGCWF